MTRILIVDDEPLVLQTLSRLLEREGYECALASDATQARELLRTSSFEVMLSDVSMPGESGLDLAKSVLKENPETAVIMVTGLYTPSISRAAIDSGAYGFVIKPFEPNGLLINVANALRRRTLEIENRAHREQLEQMVAERTAALQDAIERLKHAELEVRSSQQETIRRLSKAAEFRDNETAQHIERMSRYCTIIASKVDLPQRDRELISIASPLHDVGKIGTPDHILLKPGRLTPEEFDVMKQHAEIGYRILVGSESELLSRAAVIAWTHHEKFDGSGYPRGLKGEEIPIDGRIAAIADVFDALTSKRVYKEAMPNERALQILQEGRGKHFDPTLLDIMFNSMDEVVLVQGTFRDS